MMGVVEDLQDILHTGFLSAVFVSLNLSVETLDLASTKYPQRHARG